MTWNLLLQCLPDTRNQIKQTGCWSRFGTKERQEPFRLNKMVQMSNSCLFIKCEIRFSDLFYQVEKALPAPV